MKLKQTQIPSNCPCKNDGTCSGTETNAIAQVVALVIWMGICETETNINCTLECMCNNDGTCSGDESKVNCPGDCPSDFEGVCCGFETAYGCPIDCSHDCCNVGVPLCNNQAIQDCVCSVKSFCCSKTWNSLCCFSDHGRMQCLWARQWWSLRCRRRSNKLHFSRMIVTHQKGPTRTIFVETGVT